MPFQSVVNVKQAFGVPGEVLTDEPTRAQSLIVNSAGKPNMIGSAFTKDASTGIASVGGAIGPGIVFAGILANPKEYASFGSGGNPLAPTMHIPDNNQGDFLEMGCIVVNVSTACKIGDAVFFDTATGALSTAAPGDSAPAGTEQVPNAYVHRYPVTNANGGLTAIRLTN